MRDELILALDLYIREGPSASAESREELSQVLRSIPIEQELTAEPTFRSRQAVAYKLHNFVGIDPARATAGFPHGGRGDQLVGTEFAKDTERLSDVSGAIRANLGSLPAPEAEETVDEVTDAEEGAVLTRVHRKRERNAKLRATKMNRTLVETGRLACEACDLDFAERYRVSRPRLHRMPPPPADPHT